MSLQLKTFEGLALNITPNSPFHSMANSTMAQAFLNTQQLDSASFFIKRAALTAKKYEDKGRYFLTGQLFESLKILILQCGLMSKWSE